MSKRMGAFGRTLLRQLVRVIENGDIKEVESIWDYLLTYKKQFDQGIDAIESSTINLVDDEISRILTKREWQLYSFLHQQRGKIVSNEEIIHAIWGSRTLDPSALGQLLKRVVNKAEPYGIKIHNSRGEGYWMEE